MKKAISIWMLVAGICLVLAAGAKSVTGIRSVSSARVMEPGSGAPQSISIAGPIASSPALGKSLQEIPPGPAMPLPARPDGQQLGGVRHEGSKLHAFGRTERVREEPLLPFAGESLVQTGALDLPMGQYIEPVSVSGQPVAGAGISKPGVVVGEGMQVDMGLFRRPGGYVAEPASSLKRTAAGQRDLGQFLSSEMPAQPVVGARPANVAVKRQELRPEALVQPPDAERNKLRSALRSGDVDRFWEADKRVGEILNRRLAKASDYKYREHEFTPDELAARRAEHQRAFEQFKEYSDARGEFIGGHARRTPLSPRDAQAREQRYLRIADTVLFGRPEPESVNTVTAASIAPAPVQQTPRQQAQQKLLQRLEVAGVRSPEPPRPISRQEAMRQRQELLKRLEAAGVGGGTPAMRD